MLCNDCRARLQHARGSATLVRPPFTEQDAQLRALLCAACGGLLPHPGTFDIIGGKLPQLARFGPAPDGPPPLKAARRSRPPWAGPWGSCAPSPPPPPSFLTAPRHPP